MSNPRAIENTKQKKNVETVIERHKKVIEKLEIERINKIKELKELETTATTKKELQKVEIEKVNETVAIIPKEILSPYVLAMFVNLKFMNFMNLILRAML